MVGKNSDFHHKYEGQASLILRGNTYETKGDRRQCYKILLTSVVPQDMKILELGGTRPLGRA